MTRLVRAAALSALLLAALPSCVAAIGVGDDDDDRAAAAHDRRLLELEGRLDRIEGALPK